MTYKLISVWSGTARRLRMIAAVKGRPMTEILDALVRREYTATVVNNNPHSNSNLKGTK